MSKKVLIAIGLWMASAAPHAQQRALTPSDYIEIQQLVSKYGYALDSGAPEGTGNEYAGLFTADGTFVGPGIPDNTVGRDKLGALAKIPPGSKTRRGPTYVSHYLMNHLIEPSPEGATGKVYLLVVNLGQNGAPHKLSMGGHYEDVYARTPEGWRFKRREFFRGKVSLTAEQAAPARVFSRPAQTDRAPSGKGPALTAMDYIDIRKLVAGYAYGLDGGRDNGYNYADLFAPDAVLFGRVTGRENIANLARREPHGPEYRPPLPDQRGDRADRRRRERQAVSRRDRHRRKRQALVDLSRRALRGHVREDAPGLALQDPQPGARAGAAAAPGRGSGTESLTGFTNAAQGHRRTTS